MVLRAYKGMTVDEYERFVKGRPALTLREDLDHGREDDQDLYVQPNDALFAYPFKALSYVGRPQVLLEITIDEGRKAALADMGKFVREGDSTAVAERHEYLKTIVPYTEAWRELKYLRPEVLIDAQTPIPMSQVKVIKYAPYTSDEVYDINANRPKSYLCTVEELLGPNEARIKLVGPYTDDDSFAKDNRDSEWLVKTEEIIYLLNPTLSKEESKDMLGDLGAFSRTKGVVSVSVKTIARGIRFGEKRVLPLTKDVWDIYVRFKDFRSFGAAERIK